MMKKILCMMMCLLMAFGCLAGCNNDEPDVTPTDAPDVSASPEVTDQGTETPKLSSTLSLDTDVSKYVTIGEYKGVEYVENHWSVTDEDVQKNVDTAFPHYPKITEGKVAENANVNITFIGYIDGEEDPNCTYDDKEGYNLTLGTDVMIEGFEDGIVGQEIGKEFEVKLTFPDDYQKEYAGKEVTFKITVHYVTGEAEYPEVTDQLVETETNGEYKTVEDYKKHVREELETAEKNTAHSKDISNLMEAILANVTFAELPQEEIDFYNAYVLSQNQSYANMFGMTLNDWLSQMMGTSVEDFAEYNKENAENYVKNKLVLIAIAQAEEKTLSDEDFDKRLAADMESYGFDDLDKFKTEIEANDSLENWKTSYVLNDLEEWLLENGTPVEGKEEVKEETKD